MRGIYAKRVVLILSFAVLAVEGVLLYRHYDHYYGSDAASGTTSSGAPTFQGTAPEGTTLEETTVTTGIPPAADDAAFVHRATEDNSRGDYTYLDHPRINGDPDTVVLVEPFPNEVGSKDVPYGHNIGVWYEFRDKKKWAIFDQDLAAVPAGSTFEVVVPRADQGFVHRATLLNTVDNTTYLDNPLTDGKPDVVVSVTQNWNPGGGVGVYNDHPIGVRYDRGANEWTIYNEDGARMPDGAAFNVAVTNSDGRAR